MSRASFAKRSGVDPSTVYNIERGRTKTLRTDQFERVATLLGMTPQELSAKVANGFDSPLHLPPVVAKRVRQAAKFAGQDPLVWLAKAVRQQAKEDSRPLKGSSSKTPAAAPQKLQTPHAPKPAR